MASDPKVYSDPKVPKATLGVPPRDRHQKRPLRSPHSSERGRVRSSKRTSQIGRVPPRLSREQAATHSDQRVAHNHLSGVSAVNHIYHTQETGPDKG